MVVAEALELDLLRFSFELFVFPLILDLTSGLCVLVRVDGRVLPIPFLIVLLSVCALPLVLVLLYKGFVPAVPFVPLALAKDLFDELIDELMLL